MTKPLLSIIVPVYNAEKTITAITEAVCAQSFTDFELILVDDGSSDNTLQALHGLASQDSRIIVKTQQNTGPSGARNTGLGVARGQYIQFYDADDMIAPDALQTTTQAITTSRSDILISGWQIDLQTPTGVVQNYKQIHPQANNITSAIPLFVLRSIGTDGTLYNLWNKLFRADIIQKHRIRFDESLRFGEDLLFSLGYVSHVTSIQIIPDVTYHYLTNSSTSEFSRWAISPEFRIENDKGLARFAGDSRSEEMDDVFQWVRWRWVLSYWMLIGNSKKSRSEKKALVVAGPGADLTPAKRATHIGIKNYWLERLARHGIKSPSFALTLASTLSFTKQVVKKSKLLLKR